MEQSVTHADMDTQQDTSVPSEGYDSKIRTNYQSFSKTQKKIANYILNHKDTVLQSSITVLADKIGTHPATITRFCQAIRYKGFNELKFYMENDLILSANKPKEITKGDSISTGIQKLLNYNIEALSDTMLLMDEREIKKAISLIVEAEKVYFYAQGGTGSSAQFGYHLFLQIGVTSNCFTDSSLMMMSTSHLTKKDVIICMSYSGCVEDILNVMRLARKKRIPIIVITAHPNSPFAKSADAVLSYSCNIYDDLQYLHIARICEIAMIGVLQTGIVNHMIEKNDPRLDDLKYAITSKRTK